MTMTDIKLEIDENGEYELREKIYFVNHKVKGKHYISKNKMKYKYRFSKEKKEIRDAVCLKMKKMTLSELAALLATLEESQETQ